MIKDFPSGPFATNAYIYFCNKTKIAAIIDPAPDSFDDLHSFILVNKLQIDKVILTHSHWDHFGDLKKVLDKYPVDILVLPLDQENLKNPGSDGLPMMMEIPAVNKSLTIEDGDVIDIGEQKFIVIHTPGHSPGGICLYNKEQNILISGDTLFKGSIGNLSFPTANADKMWQSLKKLEALPLSTHVYPGHGPSTTLKEEQWLKNAKEIYS